MGDGHLIEEIKQAQPGPSKRASKQAARKKGGRERAGQGRAGRRTRGAQDWTGPGMQQQRATQPHGPEPRAGQQEPSKRTRPPARLLGAAATAPLGRISGSARSGSWTLVGRQLKSLELVIGSRPFRGGRLGFYMNIRARTIPDIFFPRLINERHPDTASPSLHPGPLPLPLPLPLLLATAACHNGDTNCCCIMRAFRSPGLDRDARSRRHRFQGWVLDKCMASQLQA